MHTYGKRPIYIFQISHDNYPTPTYILSIYLVFMRNIIALFCTYDFILRLGKHGILPIAGVFVISLVAGVGSTQHMFTLYKQLFMYGSFYYKLYISM